MERLARPLQVTDGIGVSGPALDLDATVQYTDGCLRSHTSRLSVPVVQPFRCGARTSRFCWELDTGLFVLGYSPTCCTPNTSWRAGMKHNHT